MTGKKETTANQEAAVEPQNDNENDGGDEFTDLIVRRSSSEEEGPTNSMPLSGGISSIYMVLPIRWLLIICIVGAGLVVGVRHAVLFPVEQHEDAPDLSKEEEKVGINLDKDSTNHNHSDVVGVEVHQSPDDLRQLQIQNYISGTGLMINIHVTHHGGTTFCDALRQARPGELTPSFACLMPKDETGSKRPWGHNETSAYLPIVRKSYHQICWEFSHNHHQHQLEETDWEHPELLSVYISRDPMSRLLSYNGKYRDITRYGNATEERWIEYGNSSYTNNFALTIMAGTGCCDGANTDLKYLEKATQLVDRMTFVLDIACLDDSILTLAAILKMNETAVYNRLYRYHDDHSHPPAQERIGNEQIYQWLVNRNHMDTRLHEYAKSKALVNCSSGAIRDYGLQ